MRQKKYKVGIEHQQETWKAEDKDQFNQVQGTSSYT